MQKQAKRSTTQNTDKVRPTKFPSYGRYINRQDFEALFQPIFNVLNTGHFRRKLVRADQIMNDKDKFKQDYENALVQMYLLVDEAKFQTYVPSEMYDVFDTIKLFAIQIPKMIIDYRVVSFGELEHEIKQLHDFGYDPDQY